MKIDLTKVPDFESYGRINRALRTYDDHIIVIQKHPEGAKLSKGWGEFRKKFIGKWAQEPKR